MIAIMEPEVAIELTRCRWCGETFAAPAGTLTCSDLCRTVREMYLEPSCAD